VKLSRFASVCAVVALLLPAAVFAKAEADQGKVHLMDPVQIGSVRLKPGDYKVEWSTGHVVPLRFVRHDKTVVTTTAKVIELKHPSPYSDVVLTPAKNGKLKTIAEIDFDNRTEALQLETGMTGKTNSVNR
jgi:hypothetical protein